MTFSETWLWVWASTFNKVNIIFWCKDNKKIVILFHFNKANIQFNQEKINVWFCLEAMLRWWQQVRVFRHTVETVYSEPVRWESGNIPTTYHRHSEHTLFYKTLWPGVRQLENKVKECSQLDMLTKFIIMDIVCYMQWFYIKNWYLLDFF